MATSGKKILFFCSLVHWLVLMLLQSVFERLRCASGKLAKHMHARQARRECSVVTNTPECVLCCRLYTTALRLGPSQKRSGMLELMKALNTPELALADTMHECWA